MFVPLILYLLFCALCCTKFAFRCLLCLTFCFPDHRIVCDLFLFFRHLILLFAILPPFHFNSPPPSTPTSPTCLFFCPTPFPLSLCLSSLSVSLFSHLPMQIESFKLNFRENARSRTDHGADIISWPALGDSPAHRPPHHHSPRSVSLHDSLTSAAPPCSPSLDPHSFNPPQGGYQGNGGELAEHHRT